MNIASTDHSDEFQNDFFEGGVNVFAVAVVFRGHRSFTAELRSITVRSYIEYHCFAFMMKDEAHLIKCNV